MGKVGRVLVVALLSVMGVSGRAGADPEPSLWAGSWEAAPSGTEPAVPGAAYRNVVHLSVGGGEVRVRVSNRLGGAPLRLGAVTVALRQGSGPAAVPGSMRAATFAGAGTAVVPVGRDLVSDPVPLAVTAGADLLVSVETPGDSGPATYHRVALQTSYLAQDGAGRADDADGGAYTRTTGHWYYVTGVDVRAVTRGTVVAFGDSLTDGNGTSMDANHRWPDRLAERLRSFRVGVLNAGISGNRLLLDSTGGPAALSRLDADGLDRSGVRTLVLLEGINDIKGTPEVTDPADLVRAYRAIVARAHERGIRVVGATLTPYEGYSAYTAAREAVRQRVNALIRTGHVFDAYVDFDAVVRDPQQPGRIRPAYDPGDHLHFNDTGTRALADAVQLSDLL
ncbi:SGNH/GDSL hydrolase family protein [Streptomyces sp. 900105755]|uniref:SGNH/GDSL hydrolase family protein n=1 Tax=unclassified Streptomyces TaxID=2593676 RepID=UPI00089D66C7|nr:SGNH/GDSL hydrolase family protein [Streptomyces sp. Ag109_O5-10]SEE32275.1 Lysophospholipase L1 [Streptomyces sp. Ag109_O5-10]